MNARGVDWPADDCWLPAAAAPLTCARADGKHMKPGVPSRKRLWEILPLHHCVLLGASFEFRELRQMFRRTRHVDWETADEYGLHSSAVHYAKDRNDFSRLAHKMLEERNRHAVTRFKAVRSPEELLGLWRECVARGNAVSAYWAALTHPTCDPDAGEILSREMHMLAHSSFAARRAATRQILALEERAAGLDDTRTRAQKQCEALRRETDRLRKETIAAKGEAREACETAKVLRQALDQWERGDKVGALSDRIHAVSAECDAVRAEADMAKGALKNAMRQIEWFKKAHGDSPPSDCHAGPLAGSACERSAGEAPNCPDLSRRQILCVGGKTRLVPHYRELVQAANGAFSYHDGGMEDHVGRLPAMLTAADGVVCLAGDVSHAAYHLVKRYCKRTGKPCALVKNSGVGALSRSLAAIVLCGNGEWVGSVA